MIKAIALDDEPPALKVLENYCTNSSTIKLEKIFTDPNLAVKYIHKFPVDLVFLDINMPSLSGLEISKLLPKGVMVIFTTAYSEYALEGFNVNAIDYLLKPFSPQRFAQSTEKATLHFKQQRNTENLEQLFLLIRADYSLKKICIDDILYIEGSDDYIKIHLRNDIRVVTRMTVKAMLSQLPSKEFIRVHRSFIIPLTKINHVRNKVITIGEEEIPIGISYEDDFFTRYLS